MHGSGYNKCGAEKLDTQEYNSKIKLELPSPRRHFNAVGPVAADVVIRLAAHVIVDAELGFGDDQLLLRIGEYHGLVGKKKIREILNVLCSLRMCAVNSV
jgi:hypothetical protein